MAKKLDHESIHDMLENMLTGVAFLAFDEERMELLYMNNGGFRMLGYTPELGMKYVNNLLSVILEEDKPKFWQALEDILKDDGAVDTEFRTVTASGSLRWLQVRGNLYEKANGRAIILCVFIDATDRKFVENEMRMQSQWYQMLVETEGELLFDYNAKTDVFSVKKASEYGLENNQIVDRFLVKIQEYAVKDPEVRKLREVMEEALKTPRSDIVELQLSLQDGREKRWYSFHTSSIAGVDGYVTYVVGKISDIHEKKLLLKELRDKEKLDVLTGWYNEAETRAQIDQILEKSGKDDVHAFMLVNIGNLRFIADALGEEVGRKVLKDVADKIEKGMGRVDILGRASEDEFVVFVPNVGNVSNVDAIAAKVAHSTEVTLGSGEDSFMLAGNVGVSVCPYQGNTWAELLDKAERAVNSQKEDGKEGYHIYDLSGIYRKAMTDNEKPNINFYDEISTSVNLEDLLEQILNENRQNMNQLRAVLKLIIRHYGFHKSCLSLEGMDGKPGLEFQYCDRGHDWRGRATSDGSEFKWVTFLKQLHMLDKYRVVHNYDDIPQELSSQMIRNKIYTMLIQPLMIEGEVVGVFLIGECSGREWVLQRNEQKELARVLQLLQMYVLQYERHQRGKKMLDKLGVFDNFDSYVITVDSDTYELNFANRKLLEALPDLQIGDYCYRAFAGQDAPCENCVMKKLNRNDIHAKLSEEHFNGALRSWLKVHASWLQNDADSATCLLNYMDISEYFMGGMMDSKSSFDWRRL
ncbi:diguanylate cyclase [Lachnospiraceae bacterium JLR.KK008]